MAYETVYDLPASQQGMNDAGDAEGYVSASAAMRQEDRPKVAGGRQRSRHLDDIATEATARPSTPFELLEAVSARAREVQETYARLQARARALHNHMDAIQEGQGKVEATLSELEEILDQEHLRAGNRVGSGLERSRD